MSPQQPLPPPPPQAPPQNWGDFERGLPPNLPDEARDALRQSFFNDRVLPQLVHQGQSISAGRDEFMKQTERTDKTAHPFLEAAGRHAIESFTAPVLGISDKLQHFVQQVTGRPNSLPDALPQMQQFGEAADPELARQGGSVGLAHTIGGMVGEAPYWMLGMGAAGAAGEALGASEITTRALKTAAGALIQGSYDAAKAPQGQALQQGAKGAAMGGVGTGIIEFAGPLWKALKDAPEVQELGGMFEAPEAALSDKEAQAVQAVAKGTASDSQYQQASDAIIKSPRLDDQIKSWLQDQIQQTKKAGVPSSVDIGEPNGRIHVQMKLSDGSSKLLGGIVGVPLDDFTKVLSRINDHLEAGGAIDAIGGDPDVIRQFLSSLEKVNGLTDKVSTGGGSPITMGDMEVPASEAPTPPSQAEAPQEEALPARVRGSANIPLNSQGQAETKWLGQRLSEKGGLDKIYSGDLDRTVQTMTNILQAHPSTTVGNISSDWRSMARGMMEGQPEEDMRDGMNAMIQDTPDSPVPGQGQGSTQPGESFTDFKNRIQVAAAKAIRDWKLDPSQKIGIVTHYSPIKLVKNWADNGFMDIDVPSYLSRSVEEPGSVFHFAPDERGEWHMNEINPSSDDQLDPGIYFIRHGQTDWNAGAMQPAAKASTGLFEGPEKQIYDEEGNQIGAGRYKETPLVHRLTGKFDFMSEQTYGATFGSGEGVKPTIAYQPHAIEDARETLFHENLHGHLNYTGLDQHLTQHLLDDPMVSDIFHGAFPDDAKVLYQQNPDALGEEVYVYTASAIRTGNEDLLDRFGEADSGKESVLNWANDVSKSLQDELAQKADSLHKRVFERKLQNVINRATGQIDDIRAAYGHDIDLDMEGTSYVVTSPQGEKLYFASRNEAADFLETNYSPPLNVPELVPTDHLPDGVPRFAVGMEPPSVSKKPIHSDPPDPETLPRLGPQVLSSFFRPFEPWLDTVSRKLNAPELYQAFSGVRDAWDPYQNALRPYIDSMKETLGEFSKKRRSDLYNYFSATDPDSRNFALNEAKIQPEEYEKMHQFEQDFADTGFFDFLRKTIPEVRTKGVDTLYPKGVDQSLEGELFRLGKIDPDDQDILRLANTYMRQKLFNEHMAGPIDYAEQSVKDLKGGDLIEPILRRQLEYYRSVPDFTQKVVGNAMRVALDTINAGIDSVNKHLPENLQIPTTDLDPREALQKYIMFSYAGGLALRPAVLVRDALQALITTYPILGGEYLAKGMKRAFEEGGSYEDAHRYGWLISRDNLQDLISGGGEASGVEGAAEKFANKALSYINWTHNSNRLMAGYGHALKVQDALAQFAEDGDKAAWIKNSDSWFMSPSMRDKWTKEASFLTEHPDKWEDFSMRMARDLIDLTQWNYSRGAMPGVYKYQLGRLFGQYGSWPLNYIEYARRFIENGLLSDRQSFIPALARLALAHGAILNAGDAVGIDTSHWVFTQPMAYGGGPLFQAVVNVPNTFDFQTQRGADARRDIKELFWPGAIPGGEEAATLLKMVQQGDQENFWKHVMGFTPLEDKDKLRGWHRLAP